MSKKGYFEIFYGPMFSGKTEALIKVMREFQKNGEPTKIFKPRVDNRDGLHIVKSHSGFIMEGESVVDSKELLKILEGDKEIKIIGLDEIQFFDDDIVKVISSLKESGFLIYASGLNLDCFKNPFGPMPQLIGEADRSTKLQAFCAICNNPADYTFRKIDNQTKILIGAADIYEARCGECFK